MGTFLESTKSKFTAFGGLYFFSELIANIGLRAVVSDCLPIRNRRGESSFEKLRSTILAFIGGADSLMAQERLLQDEPLLQQLCPKAGSDSSYARFLGNFSQVQARQLNEKLTNISLKLRNALFPEVEEFILDIDSTVHQQYAKRMEGLGYNYNGVWGLDSLQAFDQFGFQYWMELREGGTFTSNGVAVVISQVLRKVSKKTKKIVRADSGMCNTDVFNACVTANAKYVICMRQNMLDPLLSYVTNYKKCRKIRFRDGRECEIGHTIYRTKEAYEGSRVVIIRAKQVQRDIFSDGYDYRAWVTNIGEHEKSDEEIIEMYHGRGNAENFIRELKNGFDMFHFPCKRLLANKVYGIIAAIAYNLSRYAGYLLSKKHPHFSKLIRFKLVNLACQVIKKARSTFLRFNEHHYKEVRRLLDLQYQQFVSS